MLTKPESWVVFLMPYHKKEPVKAVCAQSEWEAKELDRPGYNTLIQAGIMSEAQAEKVARDEPEATPGINKKWRSVPGIRLKVRR